ncbi:MAG: alpha-L-rhamnosidase [Clostridia bacterium]|nr:alpha-L-rhamnosidase [Clostridia bacterium]
MRYEYAKRVVYSENLENGEALLKQKPLQIGLAETDCAVLRGKGCVILDFGKELSGGARILTFSTKGKPSKVRIRFGESVSETCAELGSGYGLATNDHSVRDFETYLQNYSDMTYAQTGFRFVRIDGLSDETELVLKTVVAAVDTDDRVQLGTFECDDALVNDIFNTAAYTIRLCLQNGYFWDGIKRDRLVWIGDLYPEMRAAQCLFGDVPETLNSLEFVKNETPLPNWMNRIASYSLWWLIILADEYALNGDKTNFACHLDYVKELIKIFSDYVWEDGTIAMDWNFVDWPTNYVDGEPIEKKEDSAVGVAYLARVAMQKIIPFLQAFDEEIALCQDILRRLEASTAQVKKYKQIAGLGVWAGDVSENNKNILLAGGAKGLSTFMSYPILTGVAAYGEYEAALSMMKEYYGGMLSVGATSFWEDFDIDWLENCGRIDEMPQEGKVDIHGDKGAFCYLGFRHSLCHGWSAGVIPYFFETVVGVKSVGVGEKKFEIKPNMSGLKHIKASYPTKYGNIEIELTQTETGVERKVNAPKEIEII